MRAQTRGQTAAVVVWGLIALVIITAILASAWFSSTAASKSERATAQLAQIRKADAAAEQARAERSKVINDQLTALRRQNARQAAQDRLQRRYLARMAHELRAHGIPVPPPPRVTVTASPKAPRQHQGNPGHTGTTPRSPGPSPTPLYCQLVPALCVGLPLGLPTKLP